MGKGAQVLSQIAGVKECQRAAPLHAHACFSGSHANKNNSTQFINKSGTDGNGCLRKKLKRCCFTEVVQAFSLFFWGYSCVVSQFIDLSTRFSRRNISLQPLDLSQVSIW